MGDTIGYVLIGVLALLALQEIIRYRRCRGDESEIPYPWHSLTRRLAITLDFIAILVLVLFWPKTGPAVQLILFGLVGVAALVGFVLLWRDLHETSVNVVNEAMRMNQDASRDLSQVFVKKKPAAKGPGTNDQGPASDQHEK